MPIACRDPPHGVSGCAQAVSHPFLTTAMQGLRPLPAATHRMVSAVVLELFVRYAKVLQHSPGLLLGVLPLFLDHRGMGHSSEVGDVTIDI